MTDHLTALPNEVLLEILSYLSKPDLLPLNAVSRACYRLATPLIWQELTLVDRPSARRHDGREKEHDEHDDTPILERLLCVLRNDLIASSVQSLYHGCHLQPPDPPSVACYPLSAETLSVDPRTIKLVRLAVRRMTNVHSLRISLGHPSLTDALLRCFFDSRRANNAQIRPVRTLWLEACRVAAGLNPLIKSHPYQLPLQLTFHGLESVHLRRLPLAAGVGIDFNAVRERSEDGRYQVFTRKTSGEDVFRSRSLPNSPPATYWNAEMLPGLFQLQWLHDQQRLPTRSPSQDGAVVTVQSPLERFFKQTFEMDDCIFEDLAARSLLPPEVSAADLPHAARALVAYRGGWLEPNDLDRPTPNHQSAQLAIDVRIREFCRSYSRLQRERISSLQAAVSLLSLASKTLTSINLHGIATQPVWHPRARFDDKVTLDTGRLYRDLFRCRFPSLRSLELQYTNPDGQLPEGMYLCEKWDLRFSDLRSQDDHALAAEINGWHALDFLEAHTNLRHLSWPAQHFFSGRKVEDDVLAARVEEALVRLGRSLVDLHVETVPRDHYLRNPNTALDPHERYQASYRRFISGFAAKMTCLESITVENGLFHDGRRELLRALHACPLAKIALFDVACPLGNTWGRYYPQDLEQEVLLSWLDEEDEAAVRSFADQTPTRPPADFRFEEEWGYTGEPLLFTLARFHADTITVLKLCGFSGAPMLFDSTSLTSALLSPLKHLHHLATLVLWLDLPTRFEHDYHDAEVLEYWRNAQYSTSTALVPVTNEPLTGWARELATKFAPDAMAHYLTVLIGPHLSDRAKGQFGGVEVRAGFAPGSGLDTPIKVSYMHVRIHLDRAGEDFGMLWMYGLQEVEEW